jgi:tetratricopeptide (TPR) repeat protein
MMLNRTRWGAIACVVLGLAATQAAARTGLVEELDRLYARRDQPGAPQELAARLADAPAAERDQFDVLWRVARFKVWQGEITEDAEAKRTLGGDAATLARRAMDLDPKRVEGHYYAALGYGIYCQGVGILTILRERRDRAFVEELDRALAIDPFFDRGGPLLAKGRYYFELPWPMRDLDQSLAHYRRLLERFPDRGRARLFLVEALLKDGRKRDAVTEFDRLQGTPPERDSPESRRVSALAQSLKPKIDRER